VQLSHRHAEFATGSPDDQFVTADPANLNRRNAEQFCAFHHFYRVKRFAGDDDTALCFTKQ
jgi:hypothetical protein